MEFRCRIATEAGHVTQAIYVADDLARLRRELEEKGLVLLSAERKGGLSGGRLAGLRARRVPANDFMIFNQELATLLKAGLPLVQSLDILRRRVPNPVFRAALNDVHQRVRSGSALSEAFEAQGLLFNRVYTASLTAGERSGSLEQVLRRYVQQVKILAAARSALISALIYPIILLLLSLGVVGLIVFKVVPSFSDFYREMGHNAQLPLSTRILVAVSKGLVGHLPLLGVILVGAVAAWTFWIRRPGQRRRLDGWLLRMPLVGPVLRTFATAQVARTVATLLAGGIPLVNAVETAGHAIGNRAVAADLEDVATHVREGGSLADALNARRTFPDVAIEMIEVGESTGALAEMLNSIADFYDEANRTTLDRFSTLVQPIMLIVMGLVIGGLVLSLYMPLFNLASINP